MISQAVTFVDPEKSLVDSFNSLAKRLKKPEYWSDSEINSVRKVAKDYYIAEQHFKCCYCDQTIRTSNGRAWDLEHIVPRSKYPTFMFEPKNLAVSCIDCNSHKNDTQVLMNPSVTKYPLISGDFKILHPHFDDFNKHIGVMLDKIFFGKTPKGGFTVITCNLARFSYAYAGWDEGLADDEVVIDKYNKILDSGDKDEKRHLCVELLAISQITISRTLI